jgi:diacylglycerol kinase family enzyme
MNAREGLAEGRAKAAVDRCVEVLINPMAGGVDADAGAYVEQLLAETGRRGRVRMAGPESLLKELRAAVEASPDLLVTLAGDGTARTAASLCGPAGPLLAPLACGTMNMLSHALYGPRDWKSVLAELLVRGVETPVSGGEVDDRRFYVSAILGVSALWAEAREAVRHRRLALAARKARNAWRRAFTRRVRYRLDGRPLQASRALTLMCPLVSSAMADDAQALEAAALDPAGLAEALRLGARAVLSRLIGDWREDPAVDTERCRFGEAWTSGSRLPAILDGEPERLHKHVRIGFVPQAFRALTLESRAPTVPDASA